MFQNDAHQLNAIQGGPGTPAQTANSPLGWEIPPFQPPTQPGIRNRFHATRGRSGFAFYPPWQNTGWEISPFQPSHPRMEKAGAIMPSEQGIENRFVSGIIPRGWDIAPFQPPHPPQPDGRAGGLVRGGDGTEFPFIQFFPYGWEIAPIQPRHPRPEAAGAFMPSEAGVEAKFVPTAILWGWDGQPSFLRRTINYGPAVGGSADFL